MKDYGEKNVYKAESISSGVTCLYRPSPGTFPWFVVICVLFATLTMKHSL